MVEHSPKFDLVRRYYNYKLWSLKRVHDAVGRWITPEEFEEITGQVYE